MHDSREFCSWLMGDADAAEIQNVYDTLIGHWMLEEFSGKAGGKDTGGSS